LLHRRPRKNFPCKSVEHFNAAQNEVNQALAKNNFQQEKKKKYWQ